MSAPQPEDPQYRSTADVAPLTGAPIAAGKPEAPMETLVGRWLLLGCGSTLAVILVGLAVLAYFWLAGLAAK